MTQVIAIDDAALLERASLAIAGTLCKLETNAKQLVKTLRPWYACELDTFVGQFSIQVLVRETRGELGVPHFRGLGHLVTARFGEENAFVFDLLRRRITGSVTAAVADDQTFWDRVLLPIAMGVLGPSMSVLPVHAACLELEGTGILIAGESGAGKSTLAIALARSGFAYVSDDWTYLSHNNGHWTAHGLGVPAKLLPDAIQHFAELAKHPVCMAMNQELAYEVAPKELGARVRAVCEPRLFIFLERRSEPGQQIEQVSRFDAGVYVEQSVERLPPELDQIGETRAAMIERLTELSCWTLKYGGPPQVAVAALRNLLAEQREGVLA